MASVSSRASTMVTGDPNKAAEQASAHRHINQVQSPTLHRRGGLTPPRSPRTAPKSGGSPLRPFMRPPVIHEGLRQPPAHPYMPQTVPAAYQYVPSPPTARRTPVQGRSTPIPGRNTPVQGWQTPVQGRTTPSLSGRATPSSYTGHNYTPPAHGVVPHAAAPPSPLLSKARFSPTPGLSLNTPPASPAPSRGEALFQLQKRRNMDKEDRFADYPSDNESTHSFPMSPPTMKRLNFRPVGTANVPGFSDTDSVHSLPLSPPSSRRPFSPQNWQPFSPPTNRRPFSPATNVIRRPFSPSPPTARRPFSPQVNQQFIPQVNQQFIPQPKRSFSPQPSQRCNEYTLAPRPSSSMSYLRAQQDAAEAHSMDPVTKQKQIPYAEITPIKVSQTSNSRRQDFLDAISGLPMSPPPSYKELNLHPPVPQQPAVFRADGPLDPLPQTTTATATSSIKITAKSTPSSPKPTAKVISISPKMSHNKKPVVWSPGMNNNMGEETKEIEPDRDKASEPFMRDVSPIWSPNGDVSPKKEFRPVNIKLESKKADDKQTPASEGDWMFDYYYKNPSKQILEQHKSDLSDVEAPPKSTTASTTVTTATSSVSTPITMSQTNPSTWNGTISHFAETKSGLPQSQSPMITLLQKSREGQIPKGAIYMGSKESMEGNKKHTDSLYVLPIEAEITSKIKEKKAPHYPGLGPLDSSGVPISLRMSVDEKNQKDWYKKMFRTLHDTKADGEEKNDYKPTYVFPEDSEESDKEDESWKTMSLDRSTLNSTISSTSSVSPSRKKETWSPPSAKYRNEIYRNQPRSITEYEPGFSSIAFREARTLRKAEEMNLNLESEKESEKATDNEEKEEEEKSQIYNPPIEKPGQFSKYTCNETGTERFVKRERPKPPTEKEAHETYKQIQKGADIPISGLRLPYPERREHKFVTQQPQRVNSAQDLSNTSPIRREEDAKRRKEQIERVYAEERRKKMAHERAEIEARRHHDVFTGDVNYWLELGGLTDAEDDRPIEPARPNQKSPIPPASDRFDDGTSSEGPTLERPSKTKKSGYKIRGKARALYNFTAQNPRELTFRKHDIIYLLRKIDQNWFEGEHHGQVGIFPTNYVEVITSLEQAHAAAMSKEGQARAKYNFIAQTSVELSLKKGETVQLVRRVDENWYEGRVGGQQGIFPVSYVEILMEPTTPLMTPLSSLAPTPLLVDGECESPRRSRKAMRQVYLPSYNHGSPGQLSPASTISNGPAPTIPDAPMSPSSAARGFDKYSLDQVFDYYTSLHGSGSGYMSDVSPIRSNLHAGYASDTNMSPARMTPRSSGYVSDTNALSPKVNPHAYRQEYTPLPIKPQQQQQQRPSSSQGFHHDSSLSRSPYDRNGYQDRSPMRGQERLQNGSVSAYGSPRDSRGGYYTQQPPMQNGHSKGHSMGPYGDGMKTNSYPDISIHRKNEEPQFPRYRARYRYTPQNADELELMEGDIIYVMEKCDDGWYVGTSDRTKEFGTFPGNYVQIV